MFEFGKELRRLLGAKETDRFDQDRPLIELMDIGLLRSQARMSSVASGRLSNAHRFQSSIEAAILWRELGRRTGESEALKKSASEAEGAGRLAKTAAEASRAALEQGETSLIGADLFDAPSLIDSARQLADQGAGGAKGDPLLARRYLMLSAKCRARKALRDHDLDAAMNAAAVFDGVIQDLDAHVRASRFAAARLDAAYARLERADLLAGVAALRRDPALYAHVCLDLAQLMLRLDPESESVARGRVCELLGVSLAAGAEIEAKPDQLAEAIKILAEIGEQLPQDHSPLDFMRCRHALGVALSSLAELNGASELYDQSILAFDAALAVPMPGPAHGVVSANRAAALARRAERHGDLKALEGAEAAFKADLASTDIAKDPVGWAVAQHNLARLYEARAGLTGDKGPLSAAVYAFEAAHDVFLERGLTQLAKTALAGLARLTALARPSNA